MVIKKNTKSVMFQETWWKYSEHSSAQMINMFLL